ncbi:hypothetical protein [Aliikangiella coralliicola]|uniref:Lipoprotein n=1 Tax=Aliikangiella coralliicola TaxID=2592383 RepID=A0A545UI00_9GAMM|nr:hypothetical protein [Aliikangiella coralliicola]TQV89078.1 hypothetical protein FLL46_05995 [Aliikangiella coralliicola]
MMKLKISEYFKSALFSVLVLSGATCLSACVGDHYGYSKQEWQLMSKMQQEKAKKSFQALVAEKDKIVKGDAISQTTEAFIERNIGKRGGQTQDHL